MLTYFKCHKGDYEFMNKFGKIKEGKIIQINVVQDFVIGVSLEPVITYQVECNDEIFYVDHDTNRVI